MTRFGRLGALVALALSGLGAWAGGCGAEKLDLPRIPKQWNAVAAGDWHSCALADDGEIRCWGCNNGEPAAVQAVGACTPPVGTFVDVVVSREQTCGLLADGGIVCWGDCSAGECAAPDGSFVGIATGSAHSCGLRGDGRVVCWGCGYGVPVEWPNRGQCDAPDGVFTQIAVADSTSCGITTEGAVRCWGDFFEPDIPTGVVFAQIDLGSGRTTCGLTQEGQVLCWGGSLIAPSSTFLQISIDDWRGCGITTDGEISCWGEMLEPPAPSGRFVAVDVSWVHACAVSDEGSVQCWGADAAGRCRGPEVGEECI